MTITGTIHHIGPVETVGDKGFTKRLLVVDNGDKFNNLVPIDLQKDNTKLADPLYVGQSVTVHINVGGRAWNEKFFPSITGWKIESQAAPQAVAAPVAEDNDLPF